MSTTVRCAASAPRVNCVPSIGTVAATGCITTSRFPAKVRGGSTVTAPGVPDFLTSVTVYPFTVLVFVMSVRSVKGFTSMGNVRLAVSLSTSVAVSVYGCGAVRIVGVPVIVPPCFASAAGGV